MKNFAKMGKQKQKQSKRKVFRSMNLISAFFFRHFTFRSNTEEWLFLLLHITSQILWHQTNGCDGQAVTFLQHFSPINIQSVIDSNAESQLPSYKNKFSGL